IIRGGSGRVLVRDQGTTMSIGVDSTGRFVACGPPRDRKVILFARRAKQAGTPDTIPALSPLITERTLAPPPR
ncbi:MAG: hypothetical protein ABI647_18815, partial [Gemmatimonadota bacterium]